MISEAYNMDCMEYIGKFPDNYFDLAVVDPPYGIGADKKTKYHDGALTKYKKGFWDDKPPKPEYWKNLFKVSKNQIIWGANYFTPFLPPAKNWIVWDKKQPEGVSFSMYELAFCSIKDMQAKIFRYYNGGNKCSNNSEKAKRYIKIHQSQKPAALYKWILTNYAKPGDKILDTHLGSGSIRIAAHDLGFGFYATELDADYFTDQEKRFQNHINQGELFTSEEIQSSIYKEGTLSL